MGEASGRFSRSRTLVKPRLVLQLACKLRLLVSLRHNPGAAGGGSLLASLPYPLEGAAAGKDAAPVLASEAGGQPLGRFETPTTGQFLPEPRHDGRGSLPVFLPCLLEYLC